MFALSYCVVYVTHHASGFAMRCSAAKASRSTTQKTRPTKSYITKKTEEKIHETLSNSAKAKIS